MNKDGWGGRSIDGPVSLDEVKVEGYKSFLKLGLPFCFLSSFDRV